MKYISIGIIMLISFIISVVITKVEIPVLKRKAGQNARVIVGSDCHNPSQVWDVAIEKAYQNLYALGIHPISSLFDTSDVPSALCTKSHDEEHS